MRPEIKGEATDAPRGLPARAQSRRQGRQQALARRLLDAALDASDPDQLERLGARRDRGVRPAARARPRLGRQLGLAGAAPAGRAATRSSCPRARAIRRTRRSSAIDFEVQAGELLELLEPGDHLFGHSYGGVVSLLAAAVGRPALADRGRAAGVRRRARAPGRRRPRRRAGSALADRPRAGAVPSRRSSRGSAPGPTTPRRR